MRARRRDWRWWGTTFVVVTVATVPVLAFAQRAPLVVVWALLFAAIVAEAVHQLRVLGDDGADDPTPVLPSTDPEAAAAEVDAWLAGRAEERQAALAAIKAMGEDGEQG